MRRAPFVVMRNDVDDLAYHHAAVALDDVLDWYVDDGYTREQLRELVLEHVESVTDE